MNQNILAKEGRLRYRDRIKQNRQNTTLQNNVKTKTNYTSKLWDNARRHNNNLMTRKQKNFGAKYGNEENTTEMPNG